MLTEWKWCAVDLMTVALTWGVVIAHVWRGEAGGSAAAQTVMLGSLFMVYQYAQQASGVLVSMAANYQALARTQTDFASADLIHGQTDEGDFGVKYGTADQVLHWLLSGYTPEEVGLLGIPPREIALVRERLEGTHWKRRLPTVAMVSQTAIGEYYLRQVDY